MMLCGNNLGVLCELCGYARGLQLGAICGAGLGTCPGSGIEPGIWKRLKAQRFNPGVPGVTEDDS